MTSSFVSSGKWVQVSVSMKHFLTWRLPWTKIYKNLCSFCDCSLLDVISRFPTRVQSPRQLTFVSTHKQHCSFPAFDTFTPDHFASCCCVQLLWTDFQNLKLTVDHILLTFGREHSFFWVVFPASWEFKKKSRWKHDCWLFDSFSPCLDEFLHFFYLRSHGSCATRAFATGALNLSGFSPRKNVQQEKN